MRTTPSFVGLEASSDAARRAAQGASKKQDTKAEIALRSALFSAGCRFRKNVKTLPGKPDIVFTRARVVVFCDGDYWHGRDWESRKPKLERGANAGYWVAKIARNIERDREQQRDLEQRGWTVVRVWETDVLKNPERVVTPLLQLLRARGHVARSCRGDE